MIGLIQYRCSDGTCWIHLPGSARYLPCAGLTSRSVPGNYQLHTARLCADDPYVYCPRYSIRRIPRRWGRQAVHVL